MILSIFNLKIILDIPYRSLFLLFILIVLTSVCFFYMMELRKKRYIRFGNFRTLKKVEGSSKFNINYLILLSKVLIISILFLVATDSLEMSIMSPISDTDFVIMIDSSPSMLYEDYENTRLDAVKEMTIDSLALLPGSTKVGVISFTGEVDKKTSLTTDSIEIKQAINSIYISNNSGTAIGDALIMAGGILKTSDKRRRIILITDGKSNSGIDIEAASEVLVSSEVSVDVIGIGNNDLTQQFFNQKVDLINRSSLIPESEKRRFFQVYALPELDEEGLKTLAHSTGGSFYLIDNSNNIRNSFTNILIANNRINLDSDYYILLMISFLMVFEFLIYSKYGAL